MNKMIYSWSGGKDSTMALYSRWKMAEEKVLLTTITREYDRISMHGVRRDLLECQAQCLGVRLQAAFIPAQCTNEDCERIVGEKLSLLGEEGMNQVVYGDLFLEDVRKYREDTLRRVNMTPVFPIWGRNTAAMAREFIDLGFKAIITCIDTQALDGDLVGHAFNHDFLSCLPAKIDPCGENGEFHTFVYDGPIFKQKVGFIIGEKVLRDSRFAYCDLIKNHADA
ncbi:MAG: diphthine--ammonia ligase [Chitinophagales bacterium]